MLTGDTARNSLNKSNTCSEKQQTKIDKKRGQVASSAVGCTAHQHRARPLLRCLRDSDRWDSGAESSAFQPAHLSDKHLVSLWCNMASAPAAPRGSAPPPSRLHDAEATSTSSPPRLSAQLLLLQSNAPPVRLLCCPPCSEPVPFPPLRGRIVMQPTHGGQLGSSGQLWLPNRPSLTRRGR